MKKLLSKILPKSFVTWYKKRKLNSSQFQDTEPQEIFTQIYHENHWSSDESASGTGSDLTQTVVLIEELNALLKDKNIKSMLDIPCGDFNWMQRVDLEGINYIGADIVQELIDKTRQKYETKNIHFKVLNLISDPLPKCDLVFVRDCLVHLSFHNIYSSLENIKSSGSKYLLTTTFPNHAENVNIPTGQWRAINLELPPFNFPKPILIINEKCTENDGAFEDKSMALWEIDKIELPPIPYKL